MQPGWVSEWEKSCNLSKHKSHATSPHTKSRSLSTKPCKNCKMPPREHHIGCQMCQIAFSKSTKKVKKMGACLIFLLRGSVNFLTTVTTVTKILAQYFWKEQFDTFANQCDVHKTAFCDSRYVFLSLWFNSLKLDSHVFQGSYVDPSLKTGVWIMSSMFSV